MEDELEGVTTVLLGSGSSAWRSCASSRSFWTRGRGEKTTVVTVAANGGDGPIRVSERERSRGGERPRVREREVRGCVASSRAVQGVGKSRRWPGTWQRGDHARGV